VDSKSPQDGTVSPPCLSPRDRVVRSPRDRSRDRSADSGRGGYHHPSGRGARPGTAGGMRVGSTSGTQTSGSSTSGGVYRYAADSRSQDVDNRDMQYSLKVRDIEKDLNSLRRELQSEKDCYREGSEFAQEGAAE
jgi:hypothetical protein